MRPADPTSPVPGVSLEGYPQEISVEAGDAVDLMVSGVAGPASLSISRLIHGDPNPAGPGIRQEPVDWQQPASLSVTEQPLDAGSYVEVDAAAAPTVPGSLTIALWVRPTVLTGGWQALISRWAPDDLSYAIFATGQRTLTVAVSQDAVSAHWCTGRAWLEVEQWQFITASYDAGSGELRLYQSGSTGPAKSFADQPIDVTSRSLPSLGPLHRGRAPLVMGALSRPDDDRLHWAHFNGKLARIQLFAEALSPRDVGELRDSTEFPRRLNALAAWDFSREISGERVIDVAGGHDGRAVNMPGRGVTGPFWTGTEATMYADAPQMYDAVQLHDDDVSDARWEPTVRLRVPDSARSGIYAATVQRPRDRLILPFIVTNRREQADACFLIPTLTWQAYSSNRGPWSHTEDGLIDTTMCIYDQHRDGSMVYYVSRRRPTRSHNPSAGFPVWGAHNVTADLYLIDWLEHQEVSYTLTTDEDLHWFGRPLLDRYRCLIIACHPEYWTEPMLDALRDYLWHGGRCLYLGGNGLYWVTSVDPERPYVMEVRKSGDWLDWWAHPTPGELAHSTTLEGGGLWSRRGRSARRLIGVEMAANCFTEPEPGASWGFQRLAESYEPECAFVFEGVGDEPIGDFGLDLGSAASYEMDAALELDGSENFSRKVLAQARADGFIPLDRIPVRPRSEIALTTVPGGGAVFAAGSVTWAGSLSHDNYANNVSRITANVLHRFVNAPRGSSILDQE